MNINEQDKNDRNSEYDLQTLVLKYGFRSRTFSCLEIHMYALLHHQDIFSCIGIFCFTVGNVIQAHLHISFLKIVLFNLFL